MKVGVWGMILWLLVSCGERPGMGRGKGLSQQEKDSLERLARLDSLNQAKFGIFIHWGPYAVLGGQYRNGKKNYAEWIQLQEHIPADEYEKIAASFDPEKFDADAWVRLVRDAGAKYLVFTAKHHDGFCMYHTELTDYNIVDYTPFKRDPLKELAAACKKYHIRLGIYYSLVDWHHPEFPAKYSQRGFHGRPRPDADIRKYADYEIGQVKELLSNYGDVFVIWFDGGGAFKGVDKFSLLKGDELIKTIRMLQPGCLINDRLGKGDYGTPEQHIPGEIQDHAFEVCMTIGKHWGYNRFETDFKSTEDLIRKLVDIAHKGGNFLLNIGPKPDGTIPEVFRQRLRGMGRWLAVNGESIYGTKGSPFAQTPWGRATSRILQDGTIRLYLHVFDMPPDHVLRVPLPEKGRKVKNVRFLADTSGGNPLSFSRDEEKGILSIQMPAELPDTMDTVVVLDLEEQ